MSDNYSQDVPANDGDKVIVLYSPTDHDNHIEGKRSSKSKNSRRNQRRTQAQIAEEASYYGKPFQRPDAPGYNTGSHSSQSPNQGRAQPYAHFAQYGSFFPDQVPPTASSRQAEEASYYGVGSNTGLRPSQMPFLGGAQQYPHWPEQVPPSVTHSDPFPPGYPVPDHTELPTYPRSPELPYFVLDGRYYQCKQYLDGLKRGLKRDKRAAQDAGYERRRKDYKDTRPTVEIGAEELEHVIRRPDGSPRGSWSSNPSSSRNRQEYPQFGSDRSAGHNVRPLDFAHSGAGSGTLASEQPSSGGRRVFKSPNAHNPKNETAKATTERLAQYLPPVDSRGTQVPPRRYTDQERYIEARDDYSLGAEEYAGSPSARHGEGRRSRRTAADQIGRGHRAEPRRPPFTRSQTWGSTRETQVLPDRELQSSPEASLENYEVSRRRTADDRSSDGDLPSDGDTSPTPLEFFTIDSETDTSSRPIAPMSHSSEDEGSRSGSDSPSDGSDDPINEEDTLLESEMSRRPEWRSKNYAFRTPPARRR